VVEKVKIQSSEKYGLSKIGCHGTVKRGGQAIATPN